MGVLLRCTKPGAARRRSFGSSRNLSSPLRDGPKVRLQGRLCPGENGQVDHDKG